LVFPPSLIRKNSPLNRLMTTATIRMTIRVLSMSVAAYLLRMDSMEASGVLEALGTL
jgi:hypothetical protein